MLTRIADHPANRVEDLLPWNRQAGSMSAPMSIARLRITLDEVEPPVICILDVPADIRLDRLHEILQAAFGKVNNHLWQFHAADAAWGVPDLSWPGSSFAARKLTLGQLVDETGALELGYRYDFGDDWWHSVEIERFDDADPSATYPALVEAVGRCPPEDVGGPWGYADFLDAIVAAGREQHKALKEWYGQDFDPEDVPLDRPKTAVADLARRWNPRSTKHTARYQGGYSSTTLHPAFTGRFRSASQNRPQTTCAPSSFPAGPEFDHSKTPLHF